MRVTVKLFATLLRFRDGSRAGRPFEVELPEGSLAQDLIAEKQITGTNEPAIYLPLYYYAEKGAAERLRRMANTPSRLTEQARAALGQEDEPWSALSGFAADRSSPGLNSRRASSTLLASTRSA